MSDEGKKPDRKQQRWYRWGTIAFLGYLWSWLLLWALAVADVLPPNETLGWICYVVFWPLVMIGQLVLWVRLHL
jgi:hypothetical protein